MPRTDEDVVHRQAVLEAMHAAGVFADVAADGAGDLRRRIGRVVEAEGAAASEIARLRTPGCTRAVRDTGSTRDDPVESRERQHHAGGMRHRAAGQAGAGAARDHRHLQRVAHLQDPRAPAPRSAAAPPPSAVAGRRSGRRIRTDACPPRETAARLGARSSRRAADHLQLPFSGCLPGVVGEAGLGSFHRIGRATFIAASLLVTGIRHKASKATNIFYLCDTTGCHDGAIIRLHYTPRSHSREPP